MFGAEMVHPRYRLLREPEPLPEALTPVYSSTAGLAQHTLRALVKRALQSCDLRDTLSETLRAELRLGSFSEAVHYLHNPPPDANQQALQERIHPAWTRIKFDELLAGSAHLNCRHAER
jgi:ATP-dependent DNA helicase RecG